MYTHSPEEARGSKLLSSVSEYIQHVVDLRITRTNKEGIWDALAKAGKNLFRKQFKSIFLFVSHSALSKCFAAAGR